MELSKVLLACTVSTFDGGADMYATASTYNREEIVQSAPPSVAMLIDGEMRYVTPEDAADILACIEAEAEGPAGTIEDLFDELGV
jgi:hypothetical protein